MNSKDSYFNTAENTALTKAYMNATRQKGFKTKTNKSGIYDRIPRYDSNNSSKANLYTESLQ